MPFWGWYDFSKSYLLCMLDFGHLISLSILKIFLSSIQPWINFLCDIETFKYICDFFYAFMWSFIILKKFVYAFQYFLSNLDFVEPLGVFAATCPLNESLAFIMLIYMCRICFLKFFIIKFHSKPFFRICFFMLPFLIACYWSCTLLELVIYFWSHLTYLGSILDLVLCIRHNEYVI